MQSYSSPVSYSSLPSQLLLILSDGVFSEDPQDPAVQAAVRLARDSRLFPVCLILDDIRKKVSRSPTPSREHDSLSCTLVYGEFYVKDDAQCRKLVHFSVFQNISIQK